MQFSSARGQQVASTRAIWRAQEASAERRKRRGARARRDNFLRNSRYPYARLGNAAARDAFTHRAAESLFTYRRARGSPFRGLALHFAENLRVSWHLRRIAWNPGNIYIRLYTHAAGCCGGASRARKLAAFFRSDIVLLICIIRGVVLFLHFFLFHLIEKLLVENYCFLTTHQNSSVYMLGWSILQRATRLSHLIIECESCITCNYHSLNSKHFFKYMSTKIKQWLAHNAVWLYVKRAKRVT